jgi:hypothetical protein
MADLGAYFGNPNLQRQGARARALAGQRDVNTLSDPLTYAVVQGLLGTAPDEMGFSVLNPDYEKIKKVAEPAFALGLLGQAAPMLAPLTKGLPVGASVKLININKGIYKPDLTMEEMLKVRDIPTVERVQQSLGLVGEKEFEKMVNSQFKKYKPSSPEQEAMLVESVTLEILGKAQRSPFPRKEALDTAQRNAALPVEEGGLGLPKNNTPEMRAEAMGAIDAVHFSRKGGEYTELDSGKFAIAPFDAVGTHVGTPQAAMERFQNTVGYKVNNPNYALDELTGSSYPVKVLGDKPLLNQNGMPWGEDDLNTFLRKTGGHNYSDINGGKLTYQDLNANLRKKLFDEQGYTSIPYFNEVEGKGSVSYIVPPKNIRSQFAAFDPKRRNEADILAGVLPLGLLADEEQRKKLYELMPSLLGQ